MGKESCGGHICPYREDGSKRPRPDEVSGQGGGEDTTSPRGPGKFSWNRRPVTWALKTGRLTSTDEKDQNHQKLGVTCMQRRKEPM